MPDTDSQPPELNELNKKRPSFSLKSFFRLLKKNNTNNNASAKNQHQLANGFETFAHKLAEDVLIPRSDIIAVNSSATLDELNAAIVEHGHTRTLIYKENLDNIIGFVHIKDLFAVIAKSEKFNLKQLIRQHLVCPPSMKLLDLLKQMQIHRTHIAVVVDEYGGTDGIVTIEDIIEAIVGPIDDEHDDELETADYKITKPGIILASSRMEIEELESLIKRPLRNYTDEFDTVGGLVLAKTGNVPKKGTVIKIDELLTVEIIDATPRAIKQLKIVFTTSVD